MRTCRHHNNAGRRQIQRGKLIKQMEQLAAGMGVPYGDSQLDEGSAGIISVANDRIQNHVQGQKEPAPEGCDRGRFPIGHARQFV